MGSVTIVAVVSLLIAVIGRNPNSVAAVDYRLSKDVFPLSYDIKITPYFLPEDGDKRFTFYGETTIAIMTNSSGVREFAVHADYIDFEDVNVRSIGGKVIQFTTEYESVTDKLIFRLEEEVLPSVNYLLDFKYTGRISDGYDGLYRINYTDVEGNEKWMVATQLQRIDARKLFPCFDEPQFKALFKMHISCPKNYRSFSNTRILTTTSDDNDTDRHVDHFEVTPSMSTYLVAMIVSEFTARGDDDLLILARPEYYNKTEFSYGVARNILHMYNDLFNVSYADLGIPVLQKASLAKFIHNGMENWGLMIYKDEVLIFEDGKTDYDGMQYTITIIAHETSHSWFGDSITFEWWGYFWLNEGFARYYQYYATHTIYPEYGLDKQFIVNQLHSILNTDAVNTTQPLSEPNVASPSELARKFSSITYVKGASIIRMISHAMSEERFQKAVKEYVRENLGGSVTPSHLLKHLKTNWPSMQALDVDAFFTDWTEQVGFPLLTVAHDGRSVSITQKRYLLDPNDGSDPELRYTIPLTYTTSAERNFSSTFPEKYFTKDQDKVTFEFAEDIDWIVFNIQQSSYYRIMYGESLWRNLKDALVQDNWSGIHELNRAQMVDDLMAFAKADLVKYDFVFDWLEYLQTETEYIPWEAAFSGFAFISNYLTLEEHADFGKYILSITEKVFNTLGTSIRVNDTVLNIYNRRKVVDYNCKYGHLTCGSEVQKALREYLDSGTAVPVDMRSTVFCSGMRDGSEDDFDKLHKRFSEENVIREKLRLRNGLGCVRSPKNVEKYFDFVLSDGVPFDEKETTMKPLYEQNPENVWPVFELITSRVDEVTGVLGSWSRTATVISRVVNLFTTMDQRDAYEEFIKTNEKKFGTSASTTLYDALQELDIKFEWAASHLEPLRTYFKSKNGVSATSSISLLALVVALFLQYIK